MLFKNRIVKKIMSKIIHIFDMDDSLFDTPTFAELSDVENGGIINSDNKFNEYFMKVKASFWDILSKEVYFKRSGDFIVPVNQATNEPFSEDIIDYFINKPGLSKMFIPQNGILVLNSFPGFHKDPETLGLVLNDHVFQDYESAKNKMILTGRNEELREKIMNILRYLGIQYPNYGLQLYNQKLGVNIEQFKIKSILQSIKENGWDIVHFYEDRNDWLTASERAVTQVFPEVKFIAHLITNIKQKRSL